MILSEQQERRVAAFIQQLIRRQIMGSFQCAKQTAELLRELMGGSRWNTAQDLIALLNHVGPRLAAANPVEFCVGNIVRRTLYLVREEHVACFKEETSHAANIDPQVLQAPSLQSNVMHGQSEIAVDYSTPLKEFKTAMMTAMNGLITEIETLYKLISPQATNYIHNDEVILTHGYSKTVLEFLKAAARKRKFEVIVVESAPLLSGQEMAVVLAKENISTTVITDSAVFAIMARVNKVIVGSHAVMANGGLIATSGVNLVAQSAKYFNVPFIVTAGLFKLCPLYAFDQSTYNEIVSPDSFIPFHEAETFRSVHAENPLYDYVPPELVSLLITNSFAHSPTYIYRLLQDHYNIHDTLE